VHATADDVELGGVRVDLCLRKVAEAAGVVEVEMRDEDVPDVARVVPERSYLGDRGLGRNELWGDDEARRPEAGRGGDVVRSKPRIDQDQAGRVLDQQTARDETARVAVDEPERRRDARTHRAAVEVADHTNSFDVGP
jgi:hypothetical protein